MSVQSEINKNADHFDIVQPKPNALVESLRAFGYSLRTAIADLIDNSISANAKNVWVRFEWDGGNSKIIIKDDGEGMQEEQLINAMRPGTKSPLEERSPNDLGRFGLGLKTASFSQCRRLSVISQYLGDKRAMRRWDLDYINQSGEWRLLKKFDEDPLRSASEHIENTGTVVIWEKMDRVVDINVNADNDDSYQRFLESIENVRAHIAMVFHRYLEKPAGLKMWVNGRQIEFWDPFLKNEKATQELPSEKLFCNGNQLTVVPYILPHHSKISKDVHRKASGQKGWNAQQGFYVYRNERLLVAGDWLGLGFQKEEHCKLARIQIDLPNSMDDEWQIDVKKSRAKYPGYLRSDLKRIARITREHAVQIYRHRGKVTARKATQDHVFLWEQKIRQGKYFYQINRYHPVVDEAVRNSGKENIEILLRMLEETVPSSHIMIVSSEEPEKMGSPFDSCTYDSVRPMIKKLYLSFLQSGCTKEDALLRLLAIEPFNHTPEFIEIFKNEEE